MMKEGKREGPQKHSRGHFARVIVVVVVFFFFGFFFARGAWEALASKQLVSFLVQVAFT